MATFLIADCGELSALKDFLCRQLYLLQNDLEIKEQLLETLNCNVQTINKSRDFMYNRCNNLENKVNELNVELLTSSQLKTSMDSSIKSLREELKTANGQIAKLHNEKLLLTVELKENKSKIQLTNTMASVLVHIDGLLQKI